MPNEVKRVVSERDGMRCAFVSDEGVRCTERGFLELDHRTLVCRGGQPTVEGTRILCRPHNQYEAERRLSKDFMREKRAHGRARRGAANQPARAENAETMASDADEPITVQVDAVAQRQRAGDHACAADAEPEAAVELDREVTLAMRGMGFGAGETCRALADSAGAPATTFEARLRAALASWRTSRGSRCSEGPFDDAALRLTTALALEAAPVEAYELC
ncbi:MAG: hypothetical protein F9K40_19440 [Kofleriaceae bacterium]|nr:MAG: hypothetical protein F9K40_19440 [Kofleriaceae bacterium]